MSAPYISLIPYGKYVGQNCINISVSGCNLYCSWLNSNSKIEPCINHELSYYPYQRKELIVDISSIIQFIKDNDDVDKVFISGCEPFNQSKQILELLKQIKSIKKREIIILVETNCTIRNEDLLDFIDILMLSPKLMSCIPKELTFKEVGRDFFETFVTKHAFYLQNTSLIIQSYLDILKEKNKEWEMHFLISNMSDESEIKERFIQIYPVLRSELKNIYVHSLYNDKHMYKEAMNVVLRNNWIFSNDII